MHEIQFSCIKNILTIKITAIFLTVFLKNILYYRLYDLQMQVSLYAGEDKEKVCRNTKMRFFGKQNGEDWFYFIKLLYSLMDCLAGIMF